MCACLLALLHLRVLSLPFSLGVCVCVHIYHIYLNIYSPLLFTMLFFKWVVYYGTFF